MKTFRIVERGYDINEVNSFIDLVISRLEKVTTENNRNMAKIKELQTKIDETDDMESKLNKAILAVQETSDRMKELARTESTMIIEDAKRNADAIIHEALVNAEKTEYEAEVLKKNIKVYKSRIRNILTSQLELSEDLDKIEL